MTHSIRTKYKLSEIAFKSGFKFRDIENRKLDWKSLGSIDVNKVVDNQDYEFLERILPQIIEAPMQSILNTAVLDPAVASLFRLAQLSLQYLSFCQQFMDHTLYDLRSAFNHLQRKNMNLKNNYKRMEDEYNKAQKRIQMLLSGNTAETEETVAENPVKSISTKSHALFSCNQCTKNFLTADSLKSHQQRKHTVIEEKHELSDDNEKGVTNEEVKANEESNESTGVKEGPNIIDEDVAPSVPVVANVSNTSANDEEPTKPTESIEPAEPKEPVESIEEIQGEPDKVVQPDTGENENQANSTVCTVCLQRASANSSNVGIQCDDLLLQGNNNNNNNNNSANSTNNVSKDVKTMANFDSDVIQTAYITINELKNDILQLRNALEGQTHEIDDSELQGNQSNTNFNKLNETNEKIDVIEQKFNAFESKFVQSQNEFIESFRNLDEQQKCYMSSIQATIKEIVEKSLVEQHVDGHSKENNDDNEVILVEENSKPKGKSRQNVEIQTVIQAKPEIKPRTSIQQTPHNDSSSEESGSENGEVVCRADIHAVEQMGSGDDGEDQLSKDEIRKDIMNEFEQRLKQIGVDGDSIGLSTPRSDKAQQSLSDDREEMKKASKTFIRTRTKLKDEIERIAKGRITSASSMTSHSSKSQHSYDSSDTDEITQKRRVQTKRPQTASLQNTRKRQAKKVMRKLVENDIDESDIMNKMEKAKQVINEHRECIQELLQTTAHSPNTMIQIPRIKYATPNGAILNVDSDSTAANKYNKMPNVTTRRVVFVNLDEDS